MLFNCVSEPQKKNKCIAECYRLRKSCGQVLSALVFPPEQDLYMPIYYINNFAALCLNCVYVLNILISTARKSVIADMPLSAAYNQKMAAIRLILTAEYEILGSN